MQRPTAQFPSPIDRDTIEARDFNGTDVSPKPVLA